MKLKINDLMAFNTSYEKIKDEKMPISLAYQLSQISKSVLEAFSFYQDKYNHYLSEYAETDENGFKMNEQGNGIILKQEKLDEAHQKFKELDNYEFPIDVKKIPLSGFEELNLSPADLIGLLPFIEEEVKK